MFRRVLTISANAYREAVRARILHGIVGLAIATCAYAMLVASLTLQQKSRVLGNVGSASLSLYAVLVAVVLGATSLHRELELKTIFPILSRPLRRHEYVLGKYVGTLLTLGVFVALDTSALFLILIGYEKSVPLAVGTLGGAIAVLVALLLLLKRQRIYAIIPWALTLAGVTYWLAAPAGENRQLVTTLSVLAFAEVSIVAAVAVFFSSFSSPFLTSIFTLAIFIIGRTADTLGNLPAKMFGETVHNFGVVLAKIVPNLYLYAPARPLVLGHVTGTPVLTYVASASLHSFCYALILLLLSAVIFQRRDFQ
jgi:ABC-type transport system involved in multi-copper enzyme maturation permease subunit